MSRTRPASREIRSFDGLRGFAAILVVVYHFTPVRSDATMLSRALERSATAVDLFFVLSGFVMALTYGGLFAERVSGTALRLFIGRRVARIYPLYIAVTLLIGVLVATGHSSRGQAATLLPIAAANVALVQEWFGMPSLDFPAWSISAEWGAYLVFPLLVPLLLREAPLARVAAIAAIAAGATGLVQIDPRLSPEVIGRGGGGGRNEALGAAIQCLADFTLGIICFRGAATGLGRRVALGGRAAIPILALLLTLFVAPASPVFTALAVVLFPVLLLSLAADRGPVASILTSRVAGRLGAWSYAVYLLHPALIGPRARLASLLTRHAVPHAGVVATAIAMTVLLPLASVTYALIEVPARELVRSWSDRGARRPRSLSAAAVGIQPRCETDTVMPKG